MRLFLDSSVIIATGLGIQTKGFDQLRQFAARDDVELVTSVVVIEEVANKFRQHLMEQIEKSQSAVKRLERIVGESYGFAIKDSALDSWVSRYRDQVVSLFEDTGGRIYSYPQASHKELVSRGINRIKPFGGKNDGYRDALIWLNVMTALQDAKEGDLEVIYFGTANTIDFSDGRSDSIKLHDDLIKDLKVRDFLEDDVVLFGSLGEIISNHIKFRIAELSVIQNRILSRKWKRGEFEHDVENAIATFIEARPYVFMPAHADWMDLEVEDSRIVEYQDATVEMIENGYFRVHVRVVSESIVIWEPVNDSATAHDLIVEKLDTRWGERFRATIETSATVSFVFDDQWEELSAAVWQDDPLDIELLTVIS